MTAIHFYRCGLGRQQFMIHSWLSIPITMVGPKEARFRQVSLYISMHINAVCNNSIRTRKNSLTPALFFKCLYQFVPSQASEQSCNCVIGVSSLHHSVIFLLKFWKYSDSVVFCIFFSFLYWIKERFWQCGICSFSFYYLYIFILIKPMYYNGTEI